MANCIQCGRKLPALMFGRKICQWCVQHEAAQRGEEPENAVQRVEVAPWLRSQSSSMVVTQAIFGINVAVFVAMALAGVSIMEPTGQELIHWGANFSPYTVGGQWWRLLTCVFVHSGIIHIGFNMWCLWDLGRLAESLYGHWTFAAVYLITGVAASVTSVAWHPTRPERRRLGSDLWDCRGADRIVLSGRVFPAPRRRGGDAAQRGDVRWLQPRFRSDVGPH